MEIVGKGKKFYWVIGLFSLLAFLFWTYLQFLPTKDSLLNYLFNVIVACFYFASGIISLFYSQKAQNSTLKNIFIFFGLSLFSWSFGNLIWSYYNIVSKTEIPFPSMADFFYLLFPVFIGTGFWYLLGLFKFKPSKSNIKLSLIIIVVTFLIVFVIFTKPTIDTSQSILATLLNFLYPLTDSFLIALGVIAFTAVGQISYGMFSVVIGLFFQAAGDLLFTYRQTNNLYWNGDISDLLYLVSVVFVIIGIYRLYTKAKTMGYKLEK